MDQTRKSKTMVFPRDLPSLQSIFSTYASMMGIVMMVKPMVHTVIPEWLQNLVVSYIKSLFGSCSISTLTLINNEKDGTAHIDGMMSHNVLFSTAQAYLSGKINHDASRLRITKDNDNKNLNLYLSQGEAFSDIYQGIELKWRYSDGTKKTMDEDGVLENQHWECLELSFEKKLRDFVLNSYIPYVESKANEIKNEKRILKMYSHSDYSRWESVNFEHPSTFDTMAMNDDLKRSVLGDLHRFIKRKDYYKRVGKAWKRGYLLYGPPGTGKSSLVAAMANYLKFDIYDLQLASVQGDTALRKLLLANKNSSILVVEDIDCSIDLPTRSKTVGALEGKTTPLTLSGLLNCIDGLWSSCGNERIIIFKTNHKENLDPALVRPGRMDMHIYMGHCSFEGFKTLASNYLGLSHDNEDTHRLYPEIKQLIDGEVLTPAQVAEELMKDEDVDTALEGLVKLLNKKKCGDDDESNKKIQDKKELIVDEEKKEKRKKEKKIKEAKDVVASYGPSSRSSSGLRGRGSFYERK